MAFQYHVKSDEPVIASALLGEHFSIFHPPSPQPRHGTVTKYRRTLPASAFAINYNRVFGLMHYSLMLSMQFPF